MSKNHDINIDKAIEFADQENIILKRRKNHMLLSDYQINVLKRNGINYNNYSNFHELLFEIEEVLFNYYDDELDLVSNQIAEITYYMDTKKWEFIFSFLYIFFLNLTI